MEAKKKGLKVDKHTHYHGLGDKLFLQVIDGLNDITTAYRGTKNAKNPARRENYFLLISHYTDENGNVINVPVYVNEYGQYNRAYVDVNKIATVYGKENFYDYINRELKNGNLVRVKIKGNQVSERPAPIAGGYNEETSINSILSTAENSQEKLDAEYMQAFNAGDMETAQRMVDEAASQAFKNSVLRDKNGILIKVYHGSPEKFNVFRDRNDGELGIYFSPWETFAKGYGDTRAFYLNLQNPIIYDEEFNKTNEVPEDAADGLIYIPEDMEGGIDQKYAGDTEIVVYDSKQVKSADPITYDDEGNIIPLSKHFATKKEPIIGRNP